MTDIRLDFETYSEADLTKIGVHAYAMHPSTRVLLASYSRDGGKTIERWLPGDPCPFKPGDRILAWNSQFERLMWNTVMVRDHGWPPLPIEAFVCVAAQARLYAASPGKLEVAADFFGQPAQKNRKGHLHMLRMCRPASEKEQLNYIAARAGKRPYTGDKLNRCHHTVVTLNFLHAYCDDDVRAECAIHELLPPWRDEDLAAFHEAEYINDRGVCVDVEFAKAAVRYADEEKRWFGERLAELTSGYVTTARQFNRIKEWALPRMDGPAQRLTEFYDKDVKKNTFDADTRTNLLASDDEEPGFLRESIREFVDILDQAGKSTISKYEAIAASATEGRVKGLYMFAGAAQTGRFSSVRLQLHNLRRLNKKQAAEAPEQIEVFVRGEDVTPFGPVVHTLATLIRPTFTGWPDKDRDPPVDLVWGDWSSIEARMLPWLTMDPRADERLEAYARNEDIYLTTASGILGRTITKADEFERQAYGKVPELSLGYCGGEGAISKMAQAYGVRLEQEQKKAIVTKWRQDNPWAIDFGKTLESAAMLAINCPGDEFFAGRIVYRYDPDALGGLGALFARLPSGRELCYPNARIDTVLKPWGDHGLGITAMKGAWRRKRGEDGPWPRMSVWYGLLSENNTQGACADLLMLALRRAPFDPYRFDVVLQTHDEIAIESDNPPRDKPLLKGMMELPPPWPDAETLPLNAEVESGYRYKVPL